MYYYYLIARPRSVGTQPDDYLSAEDYDSRTYIPEIDHKAWGRLGYGRRLRQKELEVYELIDANGPEILANPCGWAELDRFDELEGISDAVLFLNNVRQGWHSAYITRRPHKAFDDKYEELKKEVKEGMGEEIFLMTEHGEGKAFNKARESNRKNEDYINCLRDAMREYAARIITREYIEAQDKARENLREVTYHIDDAAYMKELYKNQGEKDVDKTIDDLVTPFRCTYQLIGRKDKPDSDYYVLRDEAGKWMNRNDLNGYQRGVILNDCERHFEGKCKKPFGVVRIKENRGNGDQ